MKLVLLLLVIAALLAAQVALAQVEIARVSLFTKCAGMGTGLGNISDGAKPGRDGHFFIALKLDAFCEVKEIKDRADRVVFEVCDSSKKAAVDRPYAPGGLDVENEARHVNDGISLSAATLASLAEAAKAVGGDSEI